MSLLLCYAAEVSALGMNARLLGNDGKRGGMTGEEGGDDGGGIMGCRVWERRSGGESARAI